MQVPAPQLAMPVGLAVGFLCRSSALPGVPPASPSVPLAFAGALGRTGDAVIVCADAAVAEGVATRAGSVVALSAGALFAHEAMTAVVPSSASAPAIVASEMSGRFMRVRSCPIARR